MSWFEYAGKVNYGQDDKPDKYGITQKMHDIWDLVEANKPLEDGGFEITDYDREWYEDRKELWDLFKPYHIPRYELD